MKKHLWLRSRGFDLPFFHLSGLALLLLVLPYQFWGFAVVFPIYNIYLIFFGLPHNYLTWATLFPKSSRGSFLQMNTIYTAGFICAIICLIIPFSRGLDLNDWILSFISYYSLWHAYRQHHGICKVYDAVQVKRTGDLTLFADRKALNLFFGLAANGVIVWAFTHPEIKYLLSSDESYRLIYPRIPMDFFHVYCVVTALVGVYALKRAVYDRWRKGLFIPWPQLSLMTIAILTYVLPYTVMPISAMPLAVAIATMYHNVQYFGFVWLFERYRAQEFAQAGIPLQLPARFALQGSWKKYFSLAFGYSFLVIAVYLVVPHHMGLTFIYFLGLSHYVIDGYIWRRDHNKMISAFSTHLGWGTSPAPVAAAAMAPARYQDSVQPTQSSL